MAPKLYFADVSPAVRASLLTIKALGIEVELVPVNLMAGEHMKPEYLKLNPLHTVPTLQDGDFAIFDSHAINTYLTDKYAANDALYPKDLQRRAVVNQRLYFDCGILFPRVSAIVGSLLREGAKSVSKDKADLLTQGYASLETLLERSTYVAGDQLSLADFNVIATVSSANVLVPIASNRFPKIAEWMSRMQSLPYYAEANQVGLDKFVGMVKSKLS
ncbi:glutathione S-transferase 1 [Anoplophora glabripennis]|uniref:Glutathione S-transferase n=1 Tax=Anoplophora glabripennis TaxID=217634 RepID=A0A8F8QQV9_ANOGL|nr:glutathione S-transferase 1 [Anoplophora glabripennis]QYA72007.1 glutathione S-transferase [Anoplophora glabripennis]